jgi:hypothetical protein
MGNLQLPPQIHHQNVLKMLIQGISGVQRNGGGIMAEREYKKPSCLGLQSEVGDFRGNVTTCPFQGVQAGSLRDFNPIREALIWAQSNIDLEEYASKDVRQEELLSAF